MVDENKYTEAVAAFISLVPIVLRYDPRYEDWLRKNWTSLMEIYDSTLEV